VPSSWPAAPARGVCEVLRLWKGVHGVHTAGARAHLRRRPARRGARGLYKHCADAGARDAIRDLRSEGVGRAQFHHAKPRTASQQVVAAAAAGRVAARREAGECTSDAEVWRRVALQQKMAAWATSEACGRGWGRERPRRQWPGHLRGASGVGMNVPGWSGHCNVRCSAQIWLFAGSLCSFGEAITETQAMRGGQARRRLRGGGRSVASQHWWCADGYVKMMNQPPREPREP
jgi:hypothetical protein